MDTTSHAFGVAHRGLERHPGLHRGAGELHRKLPAANLERWSLLLWCTRPTLTRRLVKAPASSEPKVVVQLHVGSRNVGAVWTSCAGPLLEDAGMHGRGQCGHSRSKQSARVTLMCVRAANPSAQALFRSQSTSGCLATMLCTSACRRAAQLLASSLCAASVRLQCGGFVHRVFRSTLQCQPPHRSDVIHFSCSLGFQGWDAEDGRL